MTHDTGLPCSEAGLSRKIKDFWLLSGHKPPALHGRGPFLRSITHGEAKELQERLIGRERVTGLPPLPQLPVEALYGFVV